MFSNKYGLGKSKDSSPFHSTLGGLKVKNDPHNSMNKQHTSLSSVRDWYTRYCVQVTIWKFVFRKHTNTLNSFRIYSAEILKLTTVLSNMFAKLYLAVQVKQIGSQNNGGVFLSWRVVCLSYSFIGVKASRRTLPLCGTLCKCSVLCKRCKNKHLE